MNIEELKIGNLIKISPRENEEGILFIIDIQHSTIIGEMLVPRQGYHFRIKYNEILPLDLSEEWLIRLGFNRSKSDDIWHHAGTSLDFKFSKSEAGFLQDGSIVGHVSAMHEMQNSYFVL